MSKEDFKLTCIMLEASKVALLLSLVIVLWTNDWFLILFEIAWVGLHIILVFFFEYFVNTLNKNK